MTRSEPMRTLPLAEFLRLYNDSAYHGWSGYDANDYPPCDADDVQVCFAPDDLPHDRLGRCRATRSGESRYRRKLPFA